MATTQTSPAGPRTTFGRRPLLGRTPTVRRRSRRSAITPRWVWVIVAPSVLAIGVFVYAFIAYTGVVSVSRWQGLTQDLTPQSPLLGSYTGIMSGTRFQADIRNTVVFTTLFLVLAVVIGLVLALLVDRVILAKSMFRTLFLFPYALSFVVTGVVWRWIFNPESGLTALFEAIGINEALRAAGMPELTAGWLADPTVVASVNGAIESLVPGASFLRIELGIPVALIPIVVAACWQFGGFAMAMYLAGLGSVPDEIREAARMDGTSGWQMLRHIILPLLRPVTASLLVILGFTSLKIFDLVYVMSGSGPGFATDMPGIFVYEQMFRGLKYNDAAAAGVLMLLAVAAIAVPYLRRSLRKDPA